MGQVTDRVGFVRPECAACPGPRGSAGAGFGLIGSRPLGGWGSGIVGGVAYGIVMWVLGALIAMPARLDMPLLNLDSMAWKSLMGHMIYGAILGAVAAAPAQEGMTPAREAGRTDWDLEVLVSASCVSCWHTLTVVQQLHSTHPHLRVKVTDVDEPGWVPPPGFVGTPMFLAGGHILSLGNPTAEALRATFG